MLSLAHNRTVRFAVLVLFSLVACTKEDLSPLEHNFLPRAVESGVRLNFCTDPAQTVNSKLKYVLVFDHSGSNLVNYKIDPTTGEPDISSGGLDIQSAYGTDPTKYSRYGDESVPGTLLSFLHNTPANDPNDPAVHFALFTFSGSYTQWPTNNTFTSDVRAFENQVAYVKANTADQGSTNYLDPLRGVTSLIQGDINTAKACAAMSLGATPTATCPTPGRAVSSSYVIVFMSDGAPITSVSLNPLSVTRQPSQDILGTVAGIMGLAANSRFVDSINLFTIYYYQPANTDPFAAKLLKDMATVGNGVSYNVTSGANINYERFRPPSRLIKFSLADVFVTNASVVLSPEGEALRDSDGDGLEDAKETQLGSSPTDVDSDGNGVADLVEFVANNGAPCGQKNASGQCARGPATVNYRTGLCNGVPNQTQNNRTTFVSSDPNGLNDCEKIVLNDAGGVGVPDSNGDLIPDFLEFRNGVPFQLGTSAATDSQDSDGMSYYQKIKTSLPALTPIYRLLNPKPARYEMKIVSNDAARDCYQLNMQDLPIAGDNNRLRVDIVFRSPLLQDRFVYYIGFKSLSGSSRKLEINDWTDPGEISARTWRKWP